MDITSRQMTKIVRELNKFTTRTLRAEGIGVGELDVLHVIRKNPGVTQSVVCQITGMDKGAVARQTVNLEAKGFITRRDNPADGRSQILFPTAKADSIQKSKAQIEAQFYEWLLEPLSEEERRRFAELLDVLYQRCKSESKAGFPEISKLIKGGNEDEKQA